MNLNLLEEKVNNAPELDFGDIFNESIALFKKVWVQGFVMNLLTTIIIMLFIFIMYLPFMSFAFLNPEVFSGDKTPPVWIFLILIIYLIMMFLVFVVNLLMQASFYRICKHQDLGLSVRDNYFYYFKKVYIIKAFKLALISIGIFVISFLLCGFPFLYAIVPLYLIPLFFAFNLELTSKEIVKMSFKLGTKKWLITFAVTMIAAIAAQFVGMMLCFVGVFITMSFAFIPQYFIYKKTIGFEEAQNEKFLENNAEENIFLK
ncbi:hypothetical protein [Mesonia aestuariivivens]|uniref:Glycerophosphoryl diester phosphodiesterase membrane domain-containing protein n=1 Tax=Mesonia aestuariivivens TaxID=2796128 RepID=A0ABS6W3G7_9FLAO|nr:hypothetical protein [Mesonia aestuariivivens]MBW2962397.1 hypothetical protein [Mesonia aestuariivivens]